MVATSHLHTQEVATKGVVATSKTTDTKMVGPTVTEGVGVEEGGVVVAVVVIQRLRRKVIRLRIFRYHRAKGVRNSINPFWNNLKRNTGWLSGIHRKYPFLILVFAEIAADIR